MSDVEVFNEHLAAENERLERQLTELRAMLGKPVTVNVQSPDSHVMQQIAQYLPQLTHMSTNISMVASALQNGNVAAGIGMVAAHLDGNTRMMGRVAEALGRLIPEPPESGPDPDDRYFHDAVVEALSCVECGATDTACIALGDTRICCEGCDHDPRGPSAPGVEAGQEREALAWLVHRASGCGVVPTPAGPSAAVCPPDREDYAAADAALAAGWTPPAALAAERERADRAEAALERVRAAHVRVKAPHPPTPDICSTCWDARRPGYSIWPCPTIAALADPTGPTEGGEG